MSSYAFVGARLFLASVADEWLFKKVPARLLRPLNAILHSLSNAILHSPSNAILHSSSNAIFHSPSNAIACVRFT
eukprot:2580243-Pleurochrysis_carterae.AAC.2